MTKADKILAKMRNNPRNWTIGDVKTLAKRNGIDWRQPGTSHVTFKYPGLAPVIIPAHKTIDPVYLKQFLKMIDSIGKTNDN